MITVLYTRGDPEAAEDNLGLHPSRHEERLGSDGTPAGGRTGTRNIGIVAHAWPLPATLMPSSGALDGLEVLVAGEARSNPEAKHSSWLRDRSVLDGLKAQVRWN